MVHGEGTKTAIRTLAICTAAVILAGMVSGAQAFSLRSTEDNSRPLGVTIDRSRLPGFVDYAAEAARRAEERRLHFLAEEIVRAWRAGRWEEITALAAPEMPTYGPDAARHPDTTHRVQRRYRPAEPKVIWLGDRPQSDVIIYHGLKGRPPHHVQYHDRSTGDLRVPRHGRAMAEG